MKSLLTCDPGSELRLGGREKRRARIINGMKKKTKKKLTLVGGFVGCWWMGFCALLCAVLLYYYCTHMLQRREAVTALQRCEEDSTTRDDCADQCHAEGLFVWAESRLLQAPSVISCRGRKDPWHGHAFGFVYETSNAVAEPPGVHSTPLESERKTKLSDL